ncbi:MAG: DUF2945 domain-containing protein [Ilumatobacteraceae bacterium]
MASYRKGSKVSWKWGQGTATGKVVERFERKVTRTIKGSRITKNDRADCPAFLIEQDDGDRVLKIASELHQG